LNKQFHYWRIPIALVLMCNSHTPIRLLDYTHTQTEEFLSHSYTHVKILYYHTLVQSPSRNSFLLLSLHLHLLCILIWVTILEVFRNTTINIWTQVQILNAVLSTPRFCTILIEPKSNLKKCMKSYHNEIGIFIIILIHILTLTELQSNYIH